jgi:hypothetical protein
MQNDPRLQAPADQKACDTMLELNNYFSGFRNLLDELDRSEFGQLAHPRMQTLSSNLEAGN